MAEPLQTSCDMLERAVVPEFTGAIESIATRRQCALKGRGAFCAGPRADHTHPRSIPQPYTPHPKGQLQQQVAYSTSLHSIKTGAAIHDAPLLNWHLVSVRVFFKQIKGSKKGTRVKKEKECVSEKKKE